MYFSKLGYAQLDKNVVALRAVRSLFTIFAKEGPDFPVYEALKSVADIKSFVPTVKVPQFLQIGVSASFPPGSKAYNALYQLLLLNFESEKLFQGTYDYRIYRTDPIMRLSELIERITAQEIAYISLNTDLSGEKTLWGSYISEFVEWLHNIYRIGLDEGELSKHLLEYRKHITYKLSRNQPLEPAEKTFVCNYYPGSPYADLPGWAEITIGNENANPLVARDYARAIALSETGPISKYFRIVSNRSIEQLTAAILPGLQSLPILIGSFIPRGPVAECDLTQLTTIAYNDTLEMQGVRERIRIPLPKDVDLDDRKGSAAACTPSLPAMVIPVYYVLENSGLPFDLTEVTIELRADALDPKLPFAGLVASWHSAWRGRRVSTSNGATVSDLLTDLAVEHESYGSATPVEMSLPEGSVIDNTEPTIKGRQISFGSIATGAIAPVMYRMYFIRNGQLQSEDVDMRFYYARRGTTLVKPAFAEFIHPPMSMLFTPAEAALSYIAGEIGMTEEEMKINGLALTVCFNYAECDILFDGRTPPIDNVQNYVKTILAI